ncbi:Similar to ETNK1: Ethanolamine kinase 1 (Homo sapiens) [Cotesia congregata]|uniref:ethanolamine kinase n=1 Tax=Cotesia congregata TaxID=51543 RepID=A0A8J2H3F3_COTCN|nr:Similar to ETNK1: Ethanolamine kinase 1 (Homo sapiens) [Cotesia congregata]
MDKKKEVHIDIKIDENDYQDDIKIIVDILRPEWPKGQLQFKIFTNGITNKLIGIYYSGHYSEMLLIRIYGNKTDLLIDRKDEVRNIRVLNKAGYTHSLYATFNNGLVYEFINGEVLTPETVINPEIYWLVAKRLAQMHLLDPREYCPGINWGNAHRESIIWNKTEKFIDVTFIDFEYTGFNYQAFDIANHFAEFVGVENVDYDRYPDEAFQRSWLKIYLQAFNKSSSVSEEQVTKLFKQIKKFNLLTHFFWGCWALIQSQHSTIDFDFLEYAAMRFNEFFKCKNSNNDSSELTTQL